MAPVGGPTSLRDATGDAVDGPLNLFSILAYVVPTLGLLPVTASLGLIAAVNERSLRLESFSGPPSRFTLNGDLLTGPFDCRLRGYRAAAIVRG